VAGSRLPARRRGATRLGPVGAAEHLAATNPPYPSVLAAAAHARGVVAGDAEVLATAVAGHRSPSALASAAEDAATLFAKRGDRVAARSRLERAAEAYLRCGARRDHARIRSRLRDLGLRRPRWSCEERPVTGWESLIVTEHTVAHLVAEGLSNQQVAAGCSCRATQSIFTCATSSASSASNSRVTLAGLALANPKRLT
jgi:hypothetical protein